MNPRVLAIQVGLVVLVFGLVLVLLRRISRRHNASWESYARARGMRFQPSRGFWFTWRSARIEGAVARTPVAIDCFWRRTGPKGGAPFTRVAGRAPAPFDGSLHVRPQGDGMLPFARSADVVTVPTGDPELDGSFVVEASNPALVELLLPPEVRDALLRDVGLSPHLDASADVVEHYTVGFDDDPERLDRRCALVAALCARAPGAGSSAGRS